MGLMSDYVVKDDNPPPHYPRYPSEHRIDDDDVTTLYRDDESYISDAESILSSTPSSVFSCPPAMTWADGLPAVPVKADLRQPVFECWKLSIEPAREEVIGGTRVLGVNIKKWKSLRNQVFSGVVKNQSELVEAYKNAITSHEAKRKRSWPLRVLRGKAMSYEEDLESRCSKLPAELQRSIHELLASRGDSSSTCRRQRTWTVVHMEERYVHRFTRTQGAKVNRHKMRFWKNPKPQTPTEYHIIIRGAETGVAERTGYTRPVMVSNPWWKLDGRENRPLMRRMPSRSDAGNDMRRARSISRSRNPHRRFESPLPRERRQPFRSPSPDSYMSFEDNYSWRRNDRDDYAPREPEFRSRPRVFNPRPAPLHFPAAPTPPHSFTPPPGVTRFRPAPRVPPPPPPPDWFMPPATGENPFLSSRPPNPFHSPGVCPPYSASTTFPAPPPPPTELPVSSFAPCNLAPSVPPFTAAPKLKSLCMACKLTPDCGHFPGPYCGRLILPGFFPNPPQTHPECFACRGNLPPRPQEAFGAGAPTGYAFTNGIAPPPWIRRPPPPMCEDLNEDEDSATVLDEDDDASEHDSDVHALSGDINEEEDDDDDTKVEELVEAPNNEVKEA